MKITIGLFIILGLMACGTSELEEGELVNGNSLTETQAEVASTYGDLSGVVTNARTGQVIAGVEVTINGETATTDAGGAYSFSNIETSTYSISFSHASYMDQTLSFDLIESPDNLLNMSLLTSAYAVNKIAIVLSWGSTPGDLDSHLYVPETASSTYEISYNQIGDNDGFLDAAPFAGLDIDKVNGNGPETVVLAFDGTNTHFPRTYRYFVHDFDWDAIDPATQFLSSSAVVRVYKEGVLTNTFNVSDSATEEYWHVFDIDQNGNVIPFNNYSVAPPATIY